MTIFFLSTRYGIQFWWFIILWGEQTSGKAGKSLEIDCLGLCDGYFLRQEAFADELQQVYSCLKL